MESSGGTRWACPDRTPAGYGVQGTPEKWNSFGTAMVLTGPRRARIIWMDPSVHEGDDGVRFSGRLARRLGLITLAVGTAGAVVAMASFALFTSAATPQKDTFAAGTVIIGQDSPATNCVIQNIEPGDSGTCTYTVTYTGSLHAWVGLNVQTSAVAVAAYTPTGSQTKLGGEALLNDGTTETGGLVVSLTNVFQGSTQTSGLAVPLVHCPAAHSSGQEGSGPLLSSTACNSPLTTQLLASPFTGNPSHPNGQPAQSWSNGTRDTVTVSWHLPRTATNAYQGGKAEIRLQAQAVQASNNALVGTVPTSGWSGTATTPPTVTPGIIFTDAPGTGSPPSTLGPYTMTPFVSDSSSSDSVDGVNAPTGGTVEFSKALVGENLSAIGPVGLSNGYTGDIYAAPNTQSVTITLPPGTGAFYLYAMGAVPGTFDVTTTAQNGTTSGPIPFHGTMVGELGVIYAPYLGFYGVGGDTIQTITVTEPSGSGGVIVGDFGIAKS